MLCKKVLKWKIYLKEIILKPIEKVANMQIQSITQYEDNISEYHFNGVHYKIYQLKPRLFRIEKDGQFMFNMKAHSLQIVFDTLGKFDYDDEKTKV